MKLRDVVMGANASMYQRMDFKKIKGVYYPKTEEEVQAAIKQAQEKGFNVVPKGGGSGLSGACTGGNRERFFISSLQMREILTISLVGGYADVQPGATPDEVNAKLEPLGMKFWVAPSSRDVATVGGLVSTDGGGNDTWVNGTMRDNMLSINMLTYEGHHLIVDKNGVKSSNAELAEELNKKGMNLDDIAGSHGTLGFITEIRVIIKPLRETKTIGALVQFDDYDAMGAGILQTIDNGCPVEYGEAIVMTHEDIREGLHPPLLILEFPKDFELVFCNAKVREISRKELTRLQDMRIKLPKRNPNVGNQIALFEGFGLHGDNLEHMGNTIREIDGVLMEHELTPFIKYGHAPSKWYLGDNSPAYGLVMHSREIRPEGKTGNEIYKAVEDIVMKCEELNVTPKPEHKWPYSDKVKKARIQELRKIIGGAFNSFVFERDCASETLSSMV
ncbi:MAG: FAD-binding oxidoreductase [Candidatus Thorarchaeota archaeon]